MSKADDQRRMREANAAKSSPKDPLVDAGYGVKIRKSAVLVGPAPKAALPGKPAERSGRPRKGKKAKSTKAKAKKPAAPALPPAAPPEKPWKATLYARPGDCTYCDARRTHSRDGMKKYRDGLKKSVV